VDAHTTAGRQLGLSERGVVEIAAVIDYFAGLCSFASGIRSPREL